MKIREKINILLSVLVSLLGVTACHHAKSVAKQNPEKEPQQAHGIESEIMLMYGVPAPGDVTFDTIPQLLPDSADKQKPSVKPAQRPSCPPIMVKYGVPPQLRK